MCVSIFKLLFSNCLRLFDKNQKCLCTYSLDNVSSNVMVEDEAESESQQLCPSAGNIAGATSRQLLVSIVFEMYF